LAEEFITKGQAVTEIMQTTGYGRQVIEKKFVELETRGVIKFEDDPGDTRKKLISKDDVQKVINSLKR
jgi:predicted transcriptional regulator